MLVEGRLVGNGVGSAVTMECGIKSLADWDATDNAMVVLYAMVNDKRHDMLRMCWIIAIDRREGC